MTEVEIFIDDVSEIYPILSGIKSYGLVMDKDFFWLYNPATWDGFSNTNDDLRKSIIFTFKESANASWFALKYCK